MEHNAEFVGQDLVHNGLPYRGNDKVGKLYRELKEGTLHVYRDGKIAMSGDIAKRALLSLGENDKNGLRYGKYSPFPENLKVPK